MVTPKGALALITKRIITVSFSCPAVNFSAVTHFLSSEKKKINKPRGKCWEG